jgi:hypothetical protein
VRPEQAFPVAKQLFSNVCTIAAFDIFQGELLTTYYNYSTLFAQKRGLIALKVNENNTMDVSIKDIQKYDKTLGEWFPASSSALGDEEYERIKIADKFRALLSDTAYVSKAQTLFFQDLDINAIFFSGASELAGERWFDAYLKDQKISWNATFVDLKRNTSLNNGFKYEERYVASGYNMLNDPDLSEVKFTIYKYSNSDRLVGAKKGAKINLIGYCRELKYSGGSFFVTLTDNINDKITTLVNETKVNESSNLLDSSEKLLKLKELLDKGVITKEEFEKEKQKILKGN